MDSNQLWTAKISGVLTRICAYTPSATIRKIVTRIKLKLND